MTKNVRETVASAISAADLTWAKDGEERAVDHLVASAWAGNRLGGILWRLKYAKERTTFNVRTALWLIVDKMVVSRRIFGKKAPSYTLIATCAAALDEWMNDECEECSAKRFIRLEAVPKACQRCAGTGRMQWTEPTRRLKVGPGYNVTLYEKTLQRLQEADHRQGKGTRKASS